MKHQWSLVMGFAFALISPTAAQEMTTIVIPNDLTLREPLGRCDAAIAAGMIASSAGVPAGVEHAPGNCDHRNNVETRHSRISLQGRTVREALDLLVKLDSRYHWEVVDGVILFRPIAAVKRTDHILHITTGPLNLSNADMGDALAAVIEIFGGKYLPPPSMRTAQAQLEISTLKSDITALAGC